MKTSFKKLPGSKIDLEVTLEQKEFQPYWDAAYERALSQVNLKGFRPGAAPKELADAAVDKEKVFEEAAHNSIRWSLDEITSNHNWTIIDKPQIEVEEAKLGIKYKAVLTVFPEIKLADYKKIAKKIFSEKKEIQVEQREIDEAMEWLRKSRSAKEKPAELNDDFARRLGKFQNLEELRKSVAEGVKMEKEYKERDRLRIKALEEIIKNSEIDTPEIMVEKTRAQIKERLEPFFKAGGKSEKEIYNEINQRARKNVESNLVLYKIAEIEKIDFNPEKGIDNERVFAYLESLEPIS
jgi:FKBP-type peptidyl-prolyl cis-trans isomerase (trigger factor)